MNPVETESVPVHLLETNREVSIALLGWDYGLIWANAGVTEPLQLGSLAKYPAYRGLLLFFSER